MIKSKEDFKGLPLTDKKGGNNQYMFQKYIDVKDEYRVLVLGEKADLGLAFDGDGDRIGLVDEKGNILWNDVLVAIFAKEILGRFPGSKIIFNTLCSQIVREVIKINGGIPVMLKTGHTFIKAKIAEEKAAFGGELSGHFFFADTWFRSACLICFHFCPVKGNH